MSLLDYLKTVSLGDITYSRINRVFSDRLSEFPNNMSWFFSNEAKKFKKKLLKFKNIHNGKRCFIIANGPSLNKMDLIPLKNELTIAMNRGYLFNELYGFHPTYLASIDIVNQLAQFKDEYQNLDIPCFYNWNFRKELVKKNNIHFIKLNHRHKFEEDILQGIWFGHSVTFSCIALAYYMGFHEVILIGKDHNFNIDGNPKKKIISGEVDQNHFSSTYYKKGMKWDLPDYKGEELAYKYAKEYYEKNGRKIYDATLGGKLQVFDKIDFKKIFLSN